MEKDQPKDDEQTKIKAYSLKELAILYQTSAKTVKKWLKPIPEVGKRNGHLYTPNQIKIIFEKIGVPFVFLAATFTKMISAFFDFDGDDHRSDDNGGHNNNGSYSYDDVQKDPWRNWRK